MANFRSVRPNMHFNQRAVLECRQHDVLALYATPKDPRVIGIITPP